MVTKIPPSVRRRSDVIHLAKDMPATEEKQRQRGERKRSGDHREIEHGNGLYHLSGCWLYLLSARYLR